MEQGAVAPTSCSLTPALRVELRAQLGRRRRRASEEARNDLVAMVAAILDEHLVRVVARHHYAGDEYARDRGLQGLGIVLGYPSDRIDRNPDLLQQIRIRREASHHV